MGKQGPCCHCGTSTTPLWRNGPPDKPILCNACGSRWRTKGTLANYMPMHTGGCGANASLEYRWPRGKKVSQKLKEQKSYKRKEPSEIFREFEFSMVYSQQYGKTLEEDVSTKSSSISGLSSEGCFQPATPLEMHSTVQSTVWDSPVPSKKRTCMSRQRPTCLEKLTKTVKVSQGCESSNLSGSSEEELLYECKDSIDISEIGLGGYFIGRTNKFTREEESEASSLPINKKGPHIFDNCQDYPKVLGTDRHAHYDATIDSEQWKALKELVGFSQSCHSLLISVELEDVVNFDTFTSLFNEDEQRWLKKYIPLADNFQNAESLKRMFNSFQFKCAMSNFQHLLSEDVFGVSNSINHQSENLFQELLLVTDLVNSKWIERYSQMRNERKAREHLKVSKITGSKSVRKGKGYFGSPVTKCSQGWIYKEKENSNGQPPLGSAGRSENSDRKRTLWKTHNAESEFHESIDTGSTSKVAIGIETNHKSMFSLDSNNLFVLPNERTPTLLFESIADFTDEDSDSVLLFDVPANLSFPQAELLHLPIQKCKTSNSFNSDVRSSENVNTPSLVNSHSKSEEFSDLSGLLWNPENMETNQIVAGNAVLNPDGT